MVSPGLKSCRLASFWLHGRKDWPVMDFTNLLDGPSMAIVVGGTLVATALRVGSADCRIAVRAIAGLLRPRFRADRGKADFAAQVSQIRQDGVLRARPAKSGDGEFDEATEAFFHTRSVEGLLERHEAHRKQRLADAGTAARTLAQGADLAPIFGLAGTLVSLSQLPAEGLQRGMFMGAISMSVLTTLYGLLLANIVLGPLSRGVERRAHAEDLARHEVMEWIAGQVAQALPILPRDATPAAAHSRAAA